MKYKPVYVDTDSLMIEREIPDSKELGKVKLEMRIKKGIIVRPKFYALMDADNKDFVKIKGLGQRITYLNFHGLMNNPKVKYTKFAKFKEALRRDFIPNEIISVEKEFSLEDEKREWKFKFNPNELQDSEPLYWDYNEEDRIMAEESNKNKLKEYIDSDLFDSASVGHDISAEDFIKNEIWFERNE